MKNIFTSLLILCWTGQFSAQCIQSSGCTGTELEVCDYTPNSNDLWNEMYWWENANQNHDLGEASTSLDFTVVDSCASLMSLKFTLFLDLDADGIMETVILSDSLGSAGLGWNNVPYNNLNQPNYSGGTPRAFDERPVPAQNKYGFALETVTQGYTTIARLRWNTFADQGLYVDPELPLGKHKIAWVATDTLGNVAQCTQVFEVKDCKKPTVVCLNGLSVNIMPTGLITLWATDFLQYTEDNHTPSNLLQISIRKSGSGSGFPADNFGNPVPSVTFTCDELGYQAVELWSKDLSGNTDYCETYVLVQDNLSNCGPGMAIAACIKSWCSNAPVLGSAIYIDGNVNFAPPFSYFDLLDSLGVDGCFYSIQNSVPVASTFTISPEKDDFPLNGVTVFDLIKLRRFLLGYEPDISPYGLIAADANKSGSITGFDLLELRRLLTGMYTELPNNTSWRFITAAFEFPDSQNPFLTAFPETISIADAMESSYQADFKAIKIGDLDCDAWLGLQSPAQERGLPQRQLSLPDLTLLEGESAEISLQMAESGDWAGIQMGLQVDPEKIEIREVLTGTLPEMDNETFYQPRPGILNFVWAVDQTEHIATGQDLLNLRVKAKVPLKISEVFQIASNFEALGSLEAEPYTLGLEFREPDLTPANGTTTILVPIPNPTNGGAKIPVQLAQAGSVSLELTDLNGKRLWANELKLNAGNHLLELAPQLMPQAGVYLWRVVAGNLSASGKLVKI